MLHGLLRIKSVDQYIFLFIFEKGNHSLSLQTEYLKNAGQWIRYNIVITAKAAKE